jgi:Ala-tRNA(Pro) deacylase
MDTFEKLSQQLKAENASFRIIAHEPEGRSDRVASIRGTTVRQGAKAMFCKVTGQDLETFVLAIVPSDRRVDMKALAALLAGDKASVAPAAVAQELTGCVPGAIPPVSYDDRVTVVVDSGLIEREREIAFNAGRLDRSIILNTADYLRIFRPRVAAIASDST